MKKFLPGNIFLSLAAVMLTLLLCEVVVRAYYGEKFGKRPGFYVGDNKLGWKPAPNLNHTFFGSDFNIKIETNENGHRLGKLGKIDFNADLVILCGDSYTFGWGVSTNETFASYLDEMLFESSKGDVRVVNLAVGGYGTFQNIFRLIDFLRKYKDIRINNEEFELDVTFDETFVNFDGNYVSGGISKITEIDIITSIEAAEFFNSFRIYPNPSNGLFTMQLNLKNKENINIKVINSLSSVVFEKQNIIADGNYSETLNLSNLKAGVYFIKIESATINICEKLIIK